MGFNQTANHRPVFIPLSFLCLDQIGQGEEMAAGAVRKFNGGSPGPKFGEGIDAAHPGHDIHAHARCIGMVATEMDSVAATKEHRIEGWNSDDFGLEILECCLQTDEISGVGEDDEIGIAAKFRRAVKHAGLTAHEQGADAVLLDRRKDFEYRVRDQVSLRERGM